MATVMVVLYVVSRQLCRGYLLYVDSYGGVICSKDTVMVVLSVLRQQILWCYLIKVDS